MNAPLIPTRQQVARLTTALEREHARAEHLARQVARLTGTSVTDVKAATNKHITQHTLRAAEALLAALPPDPEWAIAARRTAIDLDNRKTAA